MQAIRITMEPILGCDGETPLNEVKRAVAAGNRLSFSWGVAPKMQQAT